MKRSDTLGWSQVKSGIFIVAALLLFAGGVLLMGDKTKMFVPKGEIRVVMTDVAGLKVGAPVWLAGVDVGIVREVRFVDPRRSNDVEVLLEIEKESLKKVGEDSRVTIKTRGLMGEKYVDITPGQRYAETPLTRIAGTEVARLDDVMQKAGTAFDRLNGIMDKIERGEGSLGRFANDPGLYDNLTNLTGELQVVARAVNEGQGTLGKLTHETEPYDRLISILSRTEETVKAIQSSDGTLSRLVHDRQLYDKMVALADKSTKAAEDVRELNRKLLSTDSTVGMLLSDRELYEKGVALIDRADSAVASFDAVARQLRGAEGTAGRLINEREAYDRLNRMIDNVDALVKDIREHPKRYINFSLF